MAEAGVDSSGESTKPSCKYGEKCYRQNQDHLKQFSHPSKENPEQKNSKRQSENGQSKADSKRPKLSRNGSSSEDGSDKPKSPAHSVDHPSLSEADGQLVSDDEDEAPESPCNVSDNIRQKFLVKMPEDFYSFWDFCKSIDADGPEDALSSLGLRLAGPYDVLSGVLKTKGIRKPSAFLIHCRYYYDPPEFQTVLVGSDPETQFHVGYFRDDPEQPPVFVAENSASKECSIRPMGENIFAAVDSLVQRKLAGKREMLTDKDKKNLEQLKDALQEWTKTCFYSLDRETRRMKARNKMVVANSFHGAGIVVPYDKKTQVGYRPLGESDASLRNMLQKIVTSKTEVLRNKHFDSLQSIINRVQFANDECDPGMGLELALDLFCFGDPQFHGTILNLLPLAYELLQRPQFARIAEAHLVKRTKNLLKITAK